jgi:hypothetical protein
MHKNTTSPLSGWPRPGLPTVRKALDNRALSRRYARVSRSGDAIAKPMQSGLICAPSVDRICL